MGIILFGITGKFAVAIFAVLTGFFANKPSKTNSDTAVKIIRRYIHFAIPLFIVSAVNAIICAIRFAGEKDTYNMIQEVLVGSLLFDENNYCAQAWCLGDFFHCKHYHICFGKQKNRCLIWALVIAVLLAADRIWLAICLLGALVREADTYINDSQMLRKRPKLFSVLKVILLVISFVIIRFDECSLTYILDGISASMIMLICLNSSILQHILSVKFLSTGGKISYEFFLIHVMVYSTNPFLIHLLENKVSYVTIVWIAIPTAFIITAVLAYLLSLLITTATKVAHKNNIALLIEK